MDLNLGQKSRSKIFEIVAAILDGPGYIFTEFRTEFIWKFLSVVLETQGLSGSIICSLGSLSCSRNELKRASKNLQCSSSASGPVSSASFLIWADSANTWVICFT